MHNRDIFSIFLTRKYVVCFHKNRLIEAILMSTHNIPFSIYTRKSVLIIPNLQLLDSFQGTQRRVRNSRGCSNH